MSVAPVEIQPLLTESSLTGWVFPIRLSLAHPEPREAQAQLRTPPHVYQRGDISAWRHDRRVHSLCSGSIAALAAAEMRSRRRGARPQGASPACCGSPRPRDAAGTRAIAVWEPQRPAQAPDASEEKPNHHDERPRPPQPPREPPPPEPERPERPHGLVPRRRGSGGRPGLRTLGVQAGARVRAARIALRALGGGVGGGVVGLRRIRLLPQAQGLGDEARPARRHHPVDEGDGRARVARAAVRPADVDLCSSSGHW